MIYSSVEPMMIFDEIFTGMKDVYNIEIAHIFIRIILILLNNKNKSKIIIYKK